MVSYLYLLFLFILDFPHDEKMTVPVFDFISNSFSGENVVLDQSIFNQIVRNDIIHKVYQYNKMYNRKTTVWVRSKGDVSGSNRKPFQQKKTGRAPQGDIRAPNLYHGGRAHGARPRDYYFPLNKKVRLMGLKCMLTTKFLENNIIVINSEKIDHHRPMLLEKSLNFLNKNKTIFVTSKTACPNFLQAVKPIKYIKQTFADGLNVMKLLENKILVLTKEGLNELIELLLFRHTNYFRNRKVPLNPASKKFLNPTDEYKFNFDPKAKLEIHTPILKGSYESIERAFTEPEKVKEEMLQQYEEEQKLIKAKKAEKKQQQNESMYGEAYLMDKRRKMLRKERRMKLLKEERRSNLKKRTLATKAAAAATAAAADKKKK